VSNGNAVRPALRVQSGQLAIFHDPICSRPCGGETLPMMANREEQMGDHGWEAGYTEGYAAGLEEAWARVSALIARGPLPAGQSKRGDALLLACRVIARPKTRGIFKRI